MSKTLKLLPTNIRKEWSDKVTILIPTYNRHPYLHRLLEYFDSYTPIPQIIILDSSSDEMQDEVLEAFQRSDRIIWKKYPSKTFVVQKIFDGLKEVKTEYSVLCADDDFIAINGLMSGLKFLDSHPDFSCFMGRCISHGMLENNVITWQPLFHGQQGARGGDPVKRMERYANGKSIMTFYGLYRTGDHLRIWERTCKHVSYWGLSELFPCMLSYLYGKVAIGNVFYWSNERNISHPYSKNLEYVKAMYNEEKINCAAQGVAIELIAKTGLLEKNAFITAYQLFKNYLRPKNINKNIKLNEIKRKFFTRLAKLCYLITFLTPFSDSRTDFQKIKLCVEFYNISPELLERTRRNYSEQINDI